eukprot:scaffold20462_cov108-Cylindrotheca_fusiformis.AAC.1
MSTAELRHPSERQKIHIKTPRRTKMPSTFSSYAILIGIMMLLSVAINSKMQDMTLVTRTLKWGRATGKDEASLIAERMPTKSPSPAVSDSISPGHLRQNGQKKPLFILHIGPPKTGTTTLQCELGLKYHELLTEKFFYLGSYYAPMCGHSKDNKNAGFFDATRPVLLKCYSSKSSPGCDPDKQWQRFTGIVLSHRMHNVIMSDEMFYQHFVQEDVDRLAAILTPHWD